MTTQPQEAGLLPCPCGQTPTIICLAEGANTQQKYHRAFGNCCNEWEFEFRADYKTGEELKALANQKWNELPRAQSPAQGEHGELLNDISDYLSYYNSAITTSYAEPLLERCVAALQGQGGGE